MRIYAKNGDKEISIHAKGHFALHDLTQATNFVWNLINDNNSTHQNNNTTGEHFTDPKLIYVSHQQVEKPIERPVVRERLPNNVVDLESLNIKKAVTENALIRCPHCGQSHCVIINFFPHIYLMRKNYVKNQFEIVATGNLNDESSLFAITKQDNVSAWDYFMQLNRMKALEEHDFVVDNDTELFCPVCKKSALFTDWKIAWNDPLTFFNSEQRCEACGGEAELVLNTDHTHTDDQYCCSNCHYAWHIGNFIGGEITSGGY